jgi:hypothetical protein
MTAMATTGTAVARDELMMMKDTNHDEGRWPMTTGGHERETTAMERRRQHKEEEHDTAKTNTMPAGTKDSSEGMTWDDSDTREVPPAP